LAASAAHVRFWRVADIRASVDGSAPAAFDPKRTFTPMRRIAPVDAN